MILGLGKSFDGDLRKIHLRDAENKYNTYKHNGLPPTPIAFSGKQSILAALSPEAGTALYFVADGSGGHVFTSSLKEHRAAVRRYQLSGNPGKSKKVINYD